MLKQMFNDCTSLQIGYVNSTLEYFGLENVMLSYWIIQPTIAVLADLVALVYGRFAPLQHLRSLCLMVTL